MLVREVVYSTERLQVLTELLRLFFVRAQEKIIHHLCPRLR